MLNDEHIVSISNEIDDSLYAYMSKYKVSSLSLSSIVLARLMRLCMATGDFDDLKTIMQLAQAETNRTERVIQ
jgi:hypothetical protein